MTDMKEVLDKFRQGPSILETALHNVTDEQADFVPAPGKWTIRQIARHLADTEFVVGMRLRQMLAEDRPTLIPFNQDLWASCLGYSHASLADSLAVFTAARIDTSRVMDAAPTESFVRVGVHPERGDNSLGEWVDLFGRHIEKHADQIRDILRKTAE